MGPTATGKTALALELASKLNGALISADSVQVFKGLDIISGKDIPKNTPFIKQPELEKNGYNTGYFTYFNTPIYLLDVVEPTSSFSVSQFHEGAKKAIDVIAKNRRLPIVVGGTGLYVSSLLNPIATSRIEPDLELRKEFEQLDVSSLQNRLKKINEKKFSSLNNSDINNKRRLIRAIEVSVYQALSDKLPITNPQYESLVIGLQCPREILKQRIDERVQERMENGALEEAKHLFQNYKYLSKQVKDANGYKQIFSYLKNEINLDEAIYRWKISEYRHAKNQMTWFRKYGDVMWFDITHDGYEIDIEKKIKKFL